MAMYGMMSTTAAGHRAANDINPALARPPNAPGAALLIGSWRSPSWRWSWCCRWSRVHRGLPQGRGRLFRGLRRSRHAGAIRLTLLVAGHRRAAQPVFGVAAAWAIAKFEFKGKAFLTR
jgi:ABC-type Fe3+ transport system permease subunit